MSSFETTLCRDDDEELEVTVEYWTERASRGSRSSLGVPEEPDDPGGVYIAHVRDADDNEVPVSDTELDRLVDRIEEHLQERCY